MPRQYRLEAVTLVDLFAVNDRHNARLIYIPSPTISAKNQVLELR